MVQPYELVRSSAKLAGVAEAVERSDVVGLDIETTAFKPFDGQVRLVQLNTGRGVFVIDLFETETLGPVREALIASQAVKVVQNAKFEQKWFLHHFDVELWPIFDTFRASAMLHNGKHVGHNLYDLYRRELGLFPTTPDRSESDWSGPLSQDQYDYAAEDVVHLPALRVSLKEKLNRAGLLQAALIEFGAIIGESSIELTGFRLDADPWLALSVENEIKATSLRKELENALPHPKGQLSMFGEVGGGSKKLRFSIDSPSQVTESFAQLGIHLEDTTENTLGMMASAHPLIPLFMKYRKIQKRATAFGPDYLENVHPQTGRIHTDFWPLTGAGRYSSSRPNLQQIPREKAYRRCFRPGEGRVILVADYSQIELRIAAQVSRDPVLLRIYLEGLDAHTSTASVISGVPIDRVTKEQRQAAKPVNFGLIYGLGAEKLVIYSQVKYGVTITLSQAKEFIKRYFETYSGVKRWHERALRDFKRDPMVRTLSGRLRYLDPEKAHGEIFNCLDDQTEALTQERGWVRGFDLTGDEHLLTKNAVTGTLEWQRMTDLKKFPDYEGPLYEFRSRSFNAVTTPDHRWLVFNKSTRRDEEKTSKQISPHGDHRIHRTGFYAGSDSLEYTNDFVELVGWFLTDGNYRLAGKKGGTRPTATLYQSSRANPHKVEMIDRLMERLGVLTGRYFYPHHSQIVQWRLHASISKVLHELFPDRIMTPAFLSKLTLEQSILLVHTMMLGDGHEDATGKRSFACGVEAGADAFQALCVLAGVATTKTHRDMSEYRPQSEKLNNVPRGGDIWYVTLLRRDKAQVLARQTRLFAEARPIWCPIVPNSFFVARREGQVFITGNTPIQGTGADGLKKALREVYHRLKPFGGRAKMVHMVHDEIVLEADDDPELLPAVKAALEDGMVSAIQPLLPSVPVLAEGAWGPSWADKA